MAHELPELPYAKNALEPHISAETLEFHHDKHHAAYVNNLNNLIPGTEFETMSLEDIIMKSSGGVFNNAAQVWNHTFYWNGLSPDGGGRPGGALADAIVAAFGSFDGFKDAFAKAAVGNFGSGFRQNAIDALEANGLNYETDFMAENLAAPEAPGLIQDGRIHPARIEELVNKCKKDVTEIIRQTGAEIEMEGKDVLVRRAGRPSGRSSRPPRRSPGGRRGCGAAPGRRIRRRRGSRRPQRAKVVSSTRSASSEPWEKRFSERSIIMLSAFSAWPIQRMQWASRAGPRRYWPSRWPWGT